MSRMRLPLVCVSCLILVVSCVLKPAVVYAQRTDLIEDLFQTLAEAKLERERSRGGTSAESSRSGRTPRGQGTRGQATNSRVDPKLDPQGRQPAANGGTAKVEARPGVITFPPKSRSNLPPSGTTVPRTSNFDPRAGRSGQAGSAEAFRANLVAFDTECARLVQSLRTDAARNAALRNVLPDAYRVSADAHALVANSGAVRQMSAFQAPYARLDEGWRQLSFSLRAVRGLSSQCSSSVRTCDELISRMSRQLQIKPQFDRHELHDLMIVAATYMQSLIDDLQLARISPAEIRRLTHDCRLLRQSLLSEADRVNETSYDEIISRFTEFIARWRQFSGQVYALQDRHLERRLDRIRECGDQTYALLWMPTPYDSGSLLVSAKRLAGASGELLDQLTMRSMMSLDATQRASILDTTNRMGSATQQLVQAVNRGDQREELQRIFASIDRDWSRLGPVFRRMNSLNYATVSAIDHECGHLRDALDVAGDPGESIGYEGLMEVAASLEATSAYLDADIRRYARYVGPTSYRQGLLDSSESFYGDTKELHRLVSQRGDLRLLQRVAGNLLDHWQSLSQQLAIIESRGLSASRAANLQRDRRELVSMVAKISAALSQR
ncbi:MAG: hypothetical protein ACR2NZ_16695 [Rubripirellula sp.]